MLVRTIQKDILKAAEIAVGTAVVGAQSLVVTLFVVFQSL